MRKYLKFLPRHSLRLSVPYVFKTLSESSELLPSFANLTKPGLNLYQIHTKPLPNLYQTHTKPYQTLIEPYQILIKPYKLYQTL